MAFKKYHIKKNANFIEIFQQQKDAHTIHQFLFLHCAAYNHGKLEIMNFQKIKFPNARAAYLENFMII